MGWDFVKLILRSKVNVSLLIVLFPLPKIKIYTNYKTLLFAYDVLIIITGSASSTTHSFYVDSYFSILLFYGIRSLLQVTILGLQLLQYNCVARLIRHTS